MKTIEKDRNILKRLVESYGKADVVKFVKHLNEDKDDDFPEYEDDDIDKASNIDYDDPNDMFGDNLSDEEYKKLVTKDVVHFVVTNSRYLQVECVIDILDYCQESQGDIMDYMVENWICDDDPDYINEVYTDWEDELEEIVNDLADCKQAWAVKSVAAQELWKDACQYLDGNTILEDGEDYGVTVYNSGNIKIYHFYNPFQENSNYPGGVFYIGIK